MSDFCSNCSGTSLPQQCKKRRYDDCVRAEANETVSSQLRRTASGGFDDLENCVDIGIRPEILEMIDEEKKVKSTSRKY